MELPSTVKSLTHNCPCLNELQGQKSRRDWGKGGPKTGPKWEPAQGEVPRPETVTEAMEHSHKGIYHDCHQKNPKNSWKSHVQIFTPNQWTEAVDLCGWIREKLEETEEEGDPVGGSTDSITLDPGNSQTLNHQLGRMHQLIWRHQHICSRRLPGLSSVREDASNPQETGDPREFRGLVEWRVREGDVGAFSWIQGLRRRYGTWNSQRVDQEGNKIWIVKRLKISKHKMLVARVSRGGACL